MSHNLVKLNLVTHVVGMSVFKCEAKLFVNVQGCLVTMLKARL